MRHNIHKVDIRRKMTRNVKTLTTGNQHPSGNVRRRGGMSAGETFALGDGISS